MRWEDNRAETTAWPSGCVEDQQTVRGTVFQTLECQLPWSGAKERRSNWCRISTFTQADLSVERPSPWGGTGCSGEAIKAEPQSTIDDKNLLAKTGELSPDNGFCSPQPAWRGCSRARKEGRSYVSLSTGRQVFAPGISLGMPWDYTA